MTDKINLPRELLVYPDSRELAAEVRDAQWADFGRMVASRLYDGDHFMRAITHGSLKSKRSTELLGHIRAYLLTGAQP